VLLALVDSLRCPAHDEESPLVLSVEEWAGPRIAEGVLGCPVCHARYRIHRGGVDFAPDADLVRHGGGEVNPVRLAAQLSLTEPGGVILLTGRYAEAHEELVRFADVTSVLVDAESTASPSAVNFQLADRLPFVTGALRGAAIDDTRGSPDFAAEVARIVRPGGRIVARNPTAVPSGMREIARDETEWVGEAGDRGAPVRLRRAGPQK
jgi:hypothetical protein